MTTGVYSIAIGICINCIIAKCALTLSRYLLATWVSLYAHRNIHSYVSFQIEKKFFFKVDPAPSWAVGTYLLATWESIYVHRCISFQIEKKYSLKVDPASSWAVGFESHQTKEYLQIEQATMKNHPRTIPARCCSTLSVGIVVCCIIY